MALAAAVAAGVLVAVPAASRGSLSGAPLLAPLAPIAAVPGNILTRDLNGDGFADVIAPEFGTDTLAVVLNDGHGSFLPLQRYAVGIKPSFVTVADFNGDGHPDIAVSNAGSADVSVLLNKGDGTFLPARSYSISGPQAGLLGVSIGTFSLEAVDVNGDGIVDLVTSNSVTNDVSVLLGRGDGTFQPARTYPIAGASSVGGIPFALAVGDFEHSGHPDVATGGLNSVVIMHNDGQGQFTAVHSYRAGLVNSCIKVGDVNGDGNLDVVATSWGGSNAQVLLGNGDGTFREGDNLASGGLVAECFSIGDLNRDGHLDLAIATTTSTGGVGVLSVLLGHGDGHFGGGASATYPVHLAPWATAIADLSHDGIADVVVANSVPPSMSVFDGNGDGTFGPPVTVAL